MIATRIGSDAKVTNCKRLIRIIYTIFGQRQSVKVVQFWGEGLMVRKHFWVWGAEWFFCALLVILGSSDNLPFRDGRNDGVDPERGCECCRYYCRQKSVVGVFKELKMGNWKRAIIVTAIVLAVASVAGCSSPVAKFHKAVRAGDLDTAEILLAEYPDVVNQQQKGRIPLFEAMRADQTDMVVLLASRGAEVNIWDYRGMTPLHRAATDGNKELAELFVASGADVDARDRIDQSALHLAAEAGHSDMAQSLITAGANPNAKNKLGRTPLHLAASAGQREAVEVLLAGNAEINTQDKCAGQTPLHYAASQGHIEVVELLIAKGADVNSRDLLTRTPEYWASIKSERNKVCAQIAEILRERQEASEELNASDE
jgi:ankyrin repeat protein